MYGGPQQDAGGHYGVPGQYPQHSQQELYNYAAYPPQGATAAAYGTAPAPPPPFQQYYGGAPNPPPQTFANDGNFMDQYRRMMEDKEKEKEDEAFKEVEATLLAEREAQAKAALEEQKRDDEAFQAVEATLLAERQAHAKRIAAENSKKRKLLPATTKRPVIASTKGKAVQAFHQADEEDDKEDNIDQSAGQREKGVEELSEQVKDTIRRTAEWVLKNPDKESLLLEKGKNDPMLSFLRDKSSPGAIFYRDLLEEHRVKEKVRLVSSGLDDLPPFMPQYPPQPTQLLQPIPVPVPMPSPVPVSSTITNRQLSSTAAPTSKAVAPSGNRAAESSGDSQRKAKRNRWGPPSEDGSEGRMEKGGAASGGGRGSPATVATEDSSKDLTKYLPKVMDKDAEKQLREQKKLQELEARIREAAKAQLQMADGKRKKDIELYQERLEHYQELAANDDGYRDRVEDAEDTGGVIEGGTWEHRKRAKEMLKTAEKALEVTLLNKGKHHISQFLPEEELKKFLSKAEKVTAGEEVAPEEDFESKKLDSSNLGMQLLQKAGWKEGEGLGAEKQGIAAPVNMNNQTAESAGVGVKSTHEVEEEDDMFDQYRKRMMLSYRFRANPLNNPRRPYY